MSSLVENIRAMAKKANRKIVLAEGNDARVVEAADKIASLGLAQITLIGNPLEIKKLCPQAKLTGVTIIDPQAANLSKYSKLLFTLRSAKGMTEDEANKLVKNPLYLGVLLVASGECDGMVAGAINATGDVLRPALQIIKTAPGISTVSSCFIMIMPKGSQYGDNGVMVFGDCAIVPNPSASEMAQIAIASAATASAIANIVPRVAMLSFSTKGSAKHELVSKVAEATKIAKELAPKLKIDGELQADAALVESVGKLKSPNSEVAGKANVLIFPDLQSGNIGYKLVQRLAGADAIGPICQGFNKPVNDLSRGCSVADVIDVVCMTVLQVSSK